MAPPGASDDVPSRYSRSLAYLRGSEASFLLLCLPLFVDSENAIWESPTWPVGSRPAPDILPMNALVAAVERRLRVPLALGLGLFFTSVVSAQLATGWRGGTNSDMQTGSNWDAGFGSNANLFIGQGWHNFGRGGSTTLNNASSYSGYRFTFENITGGANQTFTLQGSQVTLFDFGGNSPAVINNSGVNQIVNFTGGSGLIFNAGPANVSLIQANGATGGNLTFNGPIVIGGTTNQVRISGANSNSVIFNGVISATAGTHSLVANQGNSGTTTVFSAANTYSGSTFIDSGTLQLGTAGSATGSANNSLLNLGQTTNNSPAATLNLATTAGGQSISSNLLVRTGTGTVGTRTLSSSNTSGTNTFSGNITLNANLVVTQASGGTLALSGSSIDLQGNTLGLTGAGATYNVTSDLSNTTGNGNLNVGASGQAVTATLSGNSSYGGATTLQGGSTLNVGSNTALGNSLLTTANTGGTLVASGGARTISNNISISTGNLTIGGSNAFVLNGTLTNNGAARTLTVSNSALTTQAGNIFLSETSGTGRELTITGAGNLVLGGNISNFNGVGGAAGSLTFNTSFTGTATINGTNTYSGVTTLSSGGTFVLGNAAAFGNSTVAANGVSISASTPLTGGSAIANATNLGGNNTFTGSNGLEFSGAVTATTSRTVTNNIAGGDLTFSGSAVTIGGTGTTTLTFNGSGNTAVSAPIGNTSTTGNLTYSGSGTLTLSGPNTYNGTTSLNGGVLALGSSGALGSTGGISFGGGTLRYGPSNNTDYSNRFNTTPGQAISIDTNGRNVTFATGLSSSTGTLTKSGTGVLTLTANNTYTGTTTIHGGTLVADATAGTRALGGTNSIVVNAAGTLAFAQSNQVNAGTPPTLTLAGGRVNANSNLVAGNTNTLGALTLTASSIIDLALGAGTTGNTSLIFAASNAASWTGGATLSIYNWGGTAADGTVLGSGADVLRFGNSATGLNSGQLAQVIFYSDSGTTPLGEATILSDGTVVPVPEPATVAAAALALLLVARRLRRR